MPQIHLGQPELILDARADLGEGPSWNASTGCLDWVDIHAGRLHIFNPLDGTDRLFETGNYLGCTSPRHLGGWVLGLQGSLAVAGSPLPGQGLEIQHLLRPEPHFPGNRFNDGKCDPAGRFLAGSMDDAEVAASGTLYSLSGDGAFKPLITGRRISNGLTWSPDYQTFYTIDTPTRLVMAYDYDLASGAIANPRPVVSVPPAMGWPDGMTSDSEGMLWVALWSGARLSRWDPHSGRLLLEIPLPALNVSSCVFGGPDLTDLYVTSARKDMKPGQLAQYPLSGGLFRLHTDIQGMPTFEFAG